jgi:hypothetical protein
MGLGIHLKLHTWADGPGYLNGWAFGPESHDETIKEMLQSEPRALPWAGMLMARWAGDARRLIDDLTKQNL